MSIVGAFVNLLNNEKITELRKQRGWDQYELAKAADVTPSVISRMERGLQEDFKLSVIVAVAKALGTTVDVLLLPYSEPTAEIPPLLPKLANTIALLSQRPAKIQQHAAGILNGYLAALDEE